MLQRSLEQTQKGSIAPHRSPLPPQATLFSAPMPQDPPSPEELRIPNAMSREVHGHKRGLQAETGKHVLASVLCVGCSSST